MRFLRVLILLSCILFVGITVTSTPCFSEEKTPNTGWVYNWKSSGNTTYNTNSRSDNAPRYIRAPGSYAVDLYSHSNVRFSGRLLTDSKEIEEFLSDKDVPDWVKKGVYGGLGYLVEDEDGEISYQEIEGNVFERTLYFYRGDNHGCWFCGIFDTLFESINDMASALNKGMAAPCILLLGLGFVFFLLFKILQTYISFGAIEPKKFFSEILKPFLAMIFAILLIVNIKDVYAYFINPITELALSFSVKIVEEGSGGMQIVQSSIHSANEIIGCVRTAAKVEGDIGFSANVAQEISCLLQNMSSALIVNLAVANVLIEQSFANTFPALGMLLVGIIMYVTAFMIFLTCPFKLLDGMIRLLFVASLLPLWIACSVVPVTRKYTIKVWEMFLRALVSFIFLAVIMVLIFIILNVAGGIDNFDHFLELLNQDKVEDAFAEIDFNTKFLVIFVVLMLTAYSLLEKVETLVSHFMGGANLGIGDNMGKALVSMAIQMPAKKIVKPVVSKVTEKAGKKIGGKLKGMFKKKEETQGKVIPGSQKVTAGPVTIRDNIGKENETVRHFKTAEEYQKYQEQERQRREKERQEQQKKTNAGDEGGKKPSDRDNPSKDGKSDSEKPDSGKGEK